MTDESDPRSARERLSSTHREDCALRPQCQLDYERALQERDRKLWEALDKRDAALRTHIDGRFGEVNTALEGMRRTLGAAMTAGKIRNQDITPAGKAARDALEVAVGNTKLSGRPWAVALLVISVSVLVTAGAAAGYVLGEWGRPTSTASK